jgi:endonuclease YncB( thermonuclease family)
VRKLATALALGLFVASLTEVSHATDLTGVVERLNDSDEFFFCAADSCFSIRLCGVDTPSEGRPGHDETMAALGELILNKQVLCRPVGEGSVCDGFASRISRGRLVAQCFVDDSLDIAGFLIERKLGCDRKQQSGGYYSKDDPERACPD